jgi:pyridoxal phosphate enzyme (YggS family)
MGIAERIEDIRKGLPDGCTLVAVTKTHPVEKIKEAVQAGQLDLGENKVQEMVDKQPQLPPQVRWHMIGHLQRNKVKYIAGFVHLIHGTDSLKLLEEINKQGEKHGRAIPCLLQMFIAREETKFGLDKAELDEIIQALPRLPFVAVKGLMGMASNTEDTGQVRGEFRELKNLFDTLKNQPLPANCQMEILSMGMSSDYEIALQEGSTMIRVGSKIFGERQYL